VRVQQGVRWGATVVIVVMIPASIYLFVWSPTQSQKFGVIAVFVFLAACWLPSFVIFAPPFVKVTAEQVSVWGDYGGRLRQRIQRSDLAYIFRGQGDRGGRAGWGPAYFLVTLDDTPQVMIRAEDFTDEGVVELAKRLNVPVKGNFSAQVR
jgi:hypothetical protein